jgi:glycosyltransferase involved in cell wall biosynthesis
MPKLGIVVPHYNQHETLYMTLRTLLTNDVDTKVVVVDDGSVPSLVCAPPIPEDVTVIGISPNHGVQVARNTGFQYLSRFNCEYTLFCDSDVIWMPGALDKMVAALDADKGASFAYCDFVWGHMSMFAGYWDVEKLYKENYISTMSVIRTSHLMNYAYKPWNEDLDRLQDWALWLSLVDIGGRGHYVQDVLFKTPLSDDGISRTGSHAEAVKAVRAQSE